MTPEQFAKLPKNVQAYIKGIERENNDLSAKNQWLESENRTLVESTNTFIREGISHDTALPAYSDIVFKVDVDGPYKRMGEITVRIRSDKKSLEIYGADSLLVSPQASNLFYVMPKGN